jgi:hypothetical protein
MLHHVALFMQSYITTLLLHVSHLFRWGQSAQALVAFGGGILGAVLEMLTVVYGLRSW